MDNNNQAATKDDLVKFKDDILAAVVITRKIAEISDTERAANLSAHKRIQTDVNEVRTHIGMKIMRPQVNDGKYFFLRLNSSLIL